jgi:hypothetical protein
MSRFTGPLKPSVRFEVLQLDDLDLHIADQIARVAGVEDEYQQVRQELFGHIQGNTRNKKTTLIVKPLAAKLYFHTNLSPHNRDGRELPGFAYDGKAMPYVVAGLHLPHEILSSVVNPNTDSRVFPANGLGMPGVVTMFDTVTEERQADSRSPLPPRFLITSVKEQPNALTEATVGKYFEEGSNSKTVSELLDGRLGMTQTLARERVQTWRLLVRAGFDVEVSPVTLTNGMTFTLAYDAEGNIYTDIGTVHDVGTLRNPKQKPQVRGLATKKGTNSRKTSPVSITYQNSFTGNLPTEIEVVDSEGETVREIVFKDNIIFEALFARGGVFTKVNGKRVAVEVGQNIASIKSISGK